MLGYCVLTSLSAYDNIILTKWLIPLWEDGS